MVHPPMRPPISIHLALVCHSRDCDRSVLPMHQRVAPPRPLRKGGREVGPRGLHHTRVLICDDIHHDDPRLTVRFLHR